MLEQLEATVSHCFPSFPHLMQHHLLGFPSLLVGPESTASSVFTAQSSQSLGGRVWVVSKRSVDDSELGSDAGGTTPCETPHCSQVLSATFGV